MYIFLSSYVCDEEIMKRLDLDLFNSSSRAVSTSIWEGNMFF
jgi:hypothetical protein